MDVEKILLEAKEIRKENKKYLDFLKRKHPPKLDLSIQKIHDETFEKIDCLQCANCCKTTSPIFYNKDIERAAKYLRMKAVDFEENYLRVDEVGDYVLQGAPCPFLHDDNYCGIYDARPLACKEFPHTNRKNFVQLTDLTFKNLDVCPAVVKIVEGLKSVFVKTIS
jgi:uncharacterized protein